MKIRPSTIWVILITVLLTAGLIWFAIRKRAETPATASTETDTGQTFEANAGSHSNNAAFGVTGNAAVPEQSRPESQTERKVGILSTYNDVPIEFYGKIQDQFSNAVANAFVSFSVRVYNGVESTVKRGQVMTDADGRFTISGYKGESLSVVPTMAGYALASTGTFFKYSQLEDHPFVPDAGKPTVITMWKIKGSEPLVDINQRYKLRYTDSPINFDLVSGKIVPTGGDLKITVNRPPGVISGRNPQDWSINIEIIDGGFIESSQAEAAMIYAAPETGYRPNGKFGKNNGPDLVDKMFLIKSRLGQTYSKVHLLFGVNDAPDGLMNITINGVANTNGSRNWEDDKSTMASKPK